MPYMSPCAENQSRTGVNVQNGQFSCKPEPGHMREWRVLLLGVAWIRNPRGRSVDSFDPNLTTSAIQLIGR